MSGLSRNLPVFLFMVLAPACLRAQSAAQPATTNPATIAEQFLFQSVNAERAVAGLSPLTWNRTLATAARYHAEQMGTARTLSHQLSGEPDLVRRASRAGAQFSRVTENVAVGPSLMQMHDALMRSQHHRENILDASVNSLAIAVVLSGRDLWAVEDFAHDLATLTYAEQEQQVAALLQKAGVSATSTNDAKATCEKSSGYVGVRPGFVMRYVTSDLQRLPEQLNVRLAQGLYTTATVGACRAPSSRGFTSYNLAVLLYR